MAIVSRFQSTRSGPRRAWRWLVAVAAVPLIVIGLAQWNPAGAQSTTLFVAEGGNDTNDCSVAATPCATITGALAQAAPGATINVSGTIIDQVTPPAALSPITISGAQAPPSSPAVIDANQSGRAFTVGSGVTLNLNRLTIENGNAGGILNSGGTVTVTDSTIKGNTSGSGGGIGASGGTTRVTNSTIAGNAATFGGGISTQSSTVIVTNSTITDNAASSASGQGGGLRVNFGSDVVLIADTITDNSSFSGGGIFGTSAQGLSVGATILADNSISPEVDGIVGSGPNCFGATPFVRPMSLGYNLTNDTTTDTTNDCQFNQSTDVVGVEPMLGPLQNNGGPTETLLPAASSPAVGKIPNPTTITTTSPFVTPPVSVQACGNGATDQRGVARPSPPATACTIGAVEFAPLAITTTSLPVAILGAPYFDTLAATGGVPPYTWAISQGSLPQGLSLDPATGVISGTPELLGTSSFTVEVTDAQSMSVTEQLQITVGPAAVAAEGTDGAMWAQAPQLPSGWQSLGGQIIAAPAVAAVPQSSGFASPLFVATGTDHSLWVRSLDENWASLTPGLFTSCLDNPAAVVTGPPSGPMLTVACQGSNHALFAATVPVPSSGLPRVAVWTDFGGGLGAGPAVAPVDGVITYSVTAPNQQIWTRTVSTNWGPTSFFCVGHPALGMAQGATTTWFGCQGLDGQLWAGPLANGVGPQGGAIAPGPGLGITSEADFMFAEASFGSRSVWFRTTTATWASLGGSVRNGVGAVGLS